MRRFVSPSCRAMVAPHVYRLVNTPSPRHDLVWNCRGPGPPPYLPSRRSEAMSKLTLRSLTARQVNVEMSRPLHTSSGVIRTCPLVLVDLQTEEGIVGRSYVFCYTSMVLAPVARLVQSLEA